jgi:hypothetical protein
MGGLTLNVLLSFAQFERETTGALSRIVWANVVLTEVKMNTTQNDMWRCIGGVGVATGLAVLAANATAALRFLSRGKMRERNTRAIAKTNPLLGIAE